jgi:ABC-2 type transport system ATP-binding protein
VRAVGVVKRYEATTALSGVDLGVDEGEVRGLLGPNGAGKTTLLRILLGLVRPDAGAVELFERPVAPDDPEALAGVAGFVEDPRFYPYLSGRANLELLAELDGDGALSRVEGALAQVGLNERGGDRVSGYSTGMRQRLGIAACLVRAPRLLLLDEPTAGLDPGGVRDMQALIRELTADGVAVLVSSHQIGEVEDVCDSFTILRRGEVVWDGTATRLREQAPGAGHRMATSDDELSLSLAARHDGVHARPSGEGDLLVTARPGALDPYVVALGAAGVAIRRLELETSPLESMFFALTGDGATVAGGGPLPTHAEPPAASPS